MNIRTISRLLSWTLCGLLCAAPPAAWAKESQPGSCATFDFSGFYQNDKLQWAGVARVLRNNAPLFDAATGEKKTGSLPFNQQAEIQEEKKDRVKIRAFRFKDRPETTGWVAKSDLLCRNLPIKSDSGLEMKFFIKTSTVARDDSGQEPKVQPYQDPELKECVGGAGHCREGASRFHMYFVFDETDKAVLLADRYRLEEDGILLGWVDKGNGFLWNNAFSLRPKETLTSPDQQTPGTLCTYENLDDAVNRNAAACQPVVGGKEWFRSSLRIPVLDMVNAKNQHVAPSGIDGEGGQRLFYKVALARPGLVGRRVNEEKVAISPTLASRILPEYKNLSAKKKVDIFFLLDATASMEPVIDAVRGTSDKSGVIQEIIHTLKNTQGFKETQFRFGFRVYRDPYADKLFPGTPGDGIGEGHPFNDHCEQDAATQKTEFAKFEEAIAKVKVTQGDTEDDYQENLYGGLEQALKSDMTACPDHLKLLFVIGDSGYTSTRVESDRRGRGHAVAKYDHPVTREALGKLLRGGAEAGAKSNNVIPFFIQTPYKGELMKHAQSYRLAYEQFEAQTRHLLEQSLPATDVQAGAVKDHWFRLEEEKLISRLVTKVETLSSSALIDEIILDVRGGAALNAVIDRLRRERIDIPGVYWHILQRGSCGELGRQCEDRVYDTTRIGYIEADDKVAEELWISSGALSSWIRILKGFEGYFDLPENQLRRALISAMLLGLQQEIRRPPIDVAGETPAEYAQRRGGLPVRRHSPLLSYPVPSLSAENTTRNKDGRLVVLDAKNNPMKDKAGQEILAAPACELRRLALWAIKSKELLEIVERDHVRPVYKALPHQPRQCPDATTNGRALPQINEAISQTPLGPDKNYRFGHEIGGMRGYWVPQEYLP
ncbi:hypothetical protein SIID45300_00697 [Candidatus Magnetaquicoccaceae bacterium FCR-1]|uniref:VWFA domain-containing protein n=1 Tax=Candidatus Magnetaquiglobus chichijimensis TaxID=3141448 RepID=A0ABQ0C676_9PROT